MSPYEHPKEHIGADQLAAAMRAFRETLLSHRDLINRLNVFPVPDGDTGSNMSMTVDAVVDEMDEDKDGDVTKAMSHGSLMGARGNSGVILSQLLRGFANVAQEKTQMGARDFADALSAASDAAYKAVLKPAEGTVLSVAREAAEAAREMADKGAPLMEVIEHAAQRARESLADTPNHLEALKKAGVVDAGAKGFTLFFDSILHALDDRPLPQPEFVEDAAGAQQKTEVEHGESVGEYRYEVMFLLEDTRDEGIESFKQAWSAIGDSIVVVGGEGLYNCHIHSNEIGPSVEAAMTIGRPRNIRVTDLFEQIAHVHSAGESTRGSDPARTHRLGESEIEIMSGSDPDITGFSTLDGPVATAVVAVANGAGVVKLMRSLGVQSIVTGGQTMNPSTAELLAAVEAAPSKSVIVLPNNKNIIPVAQQIEALTDKSVYVVPTKSIPEAIGALFGYDSDASVDANANSMTENAERVKYGEITQAVRDTELEIGEIKAGQFLGVCSDGVISKGPTAQEALSGLLKAIVLPRHELLTVLVGADAKESETQAISELVEIEYPQLTIEIHNGGQPLYPFLIGVE